MSRFEIIAEISTVTRERRRGSFGCRSRDACAPILRSTHSSDTGVRLFDSCRGIVVKAGLTKGS